MEKIIKPKLAFENGEAVLKYERVESIEKVNGCEYLKALKQQEGKIVQAIEYLKQQLEEIEKELLKNKKEQLDLERNGYCDISHEQKKFVGGLTQTEITHSANCRHRG